MMINGIIKFIGSGLGNTVTSEVSPQNAEFDKVLNELLMLVFQNTQVDLVGLKNLFPFDSKAISSEIEQSSRDLIEEQLSKDFTLKDGTQFLLSMLYSPDLLNKLNKDFEELNSKIDELAIKFDKLKIIFNQIDFEVFKSTLKNSENLDNTELLSLLRKIYSSENLANYKNPEIMRYYFEKISSEILPQSKSINLDESLSEIKENFDILNLNRNNVVKKDENQVLLNSIIETTREEPLQKNTAKEISKGENITINDKNLLNNELTLTHTKSIEKNIELPVFKINEVSEAILKTFSTQNRTLIVQLEPPELGKIMIKLTLDNAGIKADLKVDYPHVKEMITGLIPEIKSNLQSSGIKLSDFVLDLMRDQREYRDSYQGQKRNRGNQKFIEYFA